ncbi:flagellar hook-length control protein FliK [Acidovorax delafieldii]|uniref:Flagellar hook-length control protein FliK n=1 Tax=Acidovorax delafieldii TaxID=47920 RepID=A0A561XCM3_ACIDE|nr:flagellar hook-length control protein FliK [Acidovorax delafieldii]
MEPTKVASSQGTQPAHTTRAKSSAQPAAADASDPAAGGGFLALLAALGGGAEESTLGDTSGDTLLSSVDYGTDAASLSAADTSAVAAWQGLFAPTQSRNEVGTFNGQTALGASQSSNLGFGGIAAVGQSGAQGSMVSPGTALNDMLLGGIPQGLVAETAKLDASADLKEGSPQGALTGFGRNFSRMQSASAQRGSGMGAVDAPMGSPTLGGSAARSNAVHGFSATQVASAGERAFAGVSADVTFDRSRLAQSNPATGTEAAVPLADGLLASAGALHASESSAGGRSNGDGAGAGGAWSEGASGGGAVESGNFTDATVFAEPNALGAEEQVAEQVAYWVNQKTQNAELTLQRDGQPVEVAVSLSGNEAHVSFRSDQQQTRELLDQSMAQLSDLLRSEGLVLSGMSVGTSARDRAGGGEAGQQRPRDGARQAQVVSAVPAGTASLARGGGATDRAVDVFV